MVLAALMTAPGELIETPTLVQGSALIATGLLGGLMGVAVVVRALSRLFAAGRGRS
jgi:hypothetical protein